MLRIFGTLAAAALVAAAPDVEPKKDDPKNVAQSGKNLRQIAIAMHNFHADYDKLPPPYLKGLNDKPLLSWRVMLLPYLAQDKLYKQFKLDEPWDSEHNKNLLAQMPAIYAAPGVKTKEPHSTYYQVFVGEQAMFSKDKQYTLGQITVMDGTSNTWMVVEAGDPVPWTKPQDLEYDESKPLPKLGGAYDGPFNACFGDASVRRFQKQLADGKLYEQLVRQMVTRNGGENKDVKPILVQ